MIALDRSRVRIVARRRTAWNTPSPTRFDSIGLDLLVLDSAITDDFEVTSEQVAAYRPQFEAVRRMATRENWLLTHKPMYAFGHAGVVDGMEQLFIDQEVLQSASENDFPATIQLFVGGHIHFFETLPFGGGRAPQLVVGNSGRSWTRPSRRH